MTLPPHSREPEDLLDDGRPKDGPVQEASLKLIKKEGYCTLELSTGPGPAMMTRDQSAGSELDDALLKAKKVWKFASQELESRTEEVEIWKVTFKH